MSADAVYDATLGAGNLLRQVASSDLKYNQKEVEGRLSGGIDPAEYYGGEAEPQVDFDSNDVAGVLGLMSVTAGLSIAAGTLIVPFQKRAQHGTFESGSAHNTITAANALVIPVQFKASQDGDASVSIRAYIRSTDGLVNPVAINSGAALAAQVFNAMYTMGPGYLNGSALAHLMSMTIDCGIEVKGRRSNGGNFPTRVYIYRRKPTIQYQFEDLDDIAGLGHFAAMTSAAAYFRKRSGAGFVSDASGAHCKFTFGDGLIKNDGCSARENDDGTATLTLLGETLAATATSTIP